MAVPAAVPAAVVILKRRRIGALAIIVGIIFVAAGFFLPLTRLPAPSNGTTLALSNGVVLTLPGQTAVALPLPASGGDTGLALLQHTADHPLLTTNVGSMVVDIATRAAIVLMALAAILCLVLNTLPLMRGFVGIAAGLGLLGTAVEMGILQGERMRTLALCSNASCNVDLHAGIWLCALGFAVALLGGAFGALRPLAGLISGVGFAIVGIVLGAGLAYLVAAQHVLDVVGATLPVPH